jgi:endonuclease/exonuclease/phosphatase (EEP) superfamily protein YafD
MVGAHRLRIYTVHMVAPLDGDRARWQAQLRRVGEEAPGTHGALVAAGDFNATRYHPSFRRLLSDGTRDALSAGEEDEGLGRGSDHRPIIADLVLLP